MIEAPIAFNMQVNNLLVNIIIAKLKRFTRNNVKSRLANIAFIQQDFILLKSSFDGTLTKQYYLCVTKITNVIEQPFYYIHILNVDFIMLHFK